MMSIFIGGAWPYANGSLHLGHLTALLPGDILARYYRLKGEDVLYVSGSDCNGTPIAIKAKQEGVEPKEIANQYHKEFVETFHKLGFTYDNYSRTDSPYHHDEVKRIFNSLLDHGHLYKQSVDQTFCPSCERFLPDRYVEGTCPKCGAAARGDQCEACSSLLDPLDIVDKTCKLCGDTPVVKPTEHYYFALSHFQNDLEELVEKAKIQEGWRENAIHLTERYLKEGLHDRAATRDLEVGVPVPVEGFEDKKIYVWIEAVSGYLSASKQWAEQNGEDWVPFWKQNTKSYYIHGKDNIPFHSIIWPSVLEGLDEGLSLPDHILSSEYLTIEKKKLSTSRNWAVWVPDLLERYNPDSIRYFLTINAPEYRDADFSWREFIYSHNSELLGAYGNFVNRTLKFIQKSYNGEVPNGVSDDTIDKRIKEMYSQIGILIEAGECKRAIEAVFTFVREANKYFDERQPWIQIRENEAECRNTLFTCTKIIANLAQLLSPFLPFSSEQVRSTLDIKELKWNPIVTLPTKLGEVTPLFERIDVDVIEEEREKLGK